MNHKDLDAWKQAMELVEQAYAVSAKFPAEERYGITAQLRRSAVSVPSNISEGAARRSKKEFLNFLSIALGSLAELETQLILAMRLKYGTTEEILGQLDRVRSLVLGLRRSLS